MQYYYLLCRQYACVVVNHIINECMHGMWCVDSMRDTMNVPLNHTFGKPIPWEPYGVGDLLHMRRADRFLRGRQHHRSLIAVVRNHLKKANFQSFDNLLQAFKFYDKVTILVL